MYYPHTPFFCSMEKIDMQLKTYCKIMVKNYFEIELNAKSLLPFGNRGPQFLSTQFILLDECFWDRCKTI